MFLRSPDCGGEYRTLSDPKIIPETNAHLGLEGKTLCQTHYNRLIVNENRRIARQEESKSCGHPKHYEYKAQAVAKSNKTRTKETKKSLRKVPGRLASIINVPFGTMICSRCAKQSDKDPEFKMHSEYKPPAWLKIVVIG